MGVNQSWMHLQEHIYSICFIRNLLCGNTSVSVKTDMRSHGGLVWLDSAISKQNRSSVPVLKCVPGQSGRTRSGAIKALMHCSSQPVGWASEEALQLQFLSLWRRSTPRRATENLFQHNRGRASALYQLGPPPQREESVRSPGRGGNGLMDGERRGMRALEGLVVDDPVFAHFFVCLSPPAFVFLHPRSSPYPPGARDYGNVCYSMYVVSFQGRRSRRLDKQ